MITTHLDTYYRKHSLTRVFEWLVGIGLMFLVVNPVFAQLDFEVKDDPEYLRLSQMAKKAKQEGAYDAAYRYWDTALVHSQQQQNQELIAVAMSQLGVICMYQGRYSDALKHMLAGVLIQEELQDSLQMAKSYNYIAAVHHAQSDYETAIKYYTKSQTITELVGDQRTIAILYNNLGSLYEDKGEYDKGLEYHRKSMAIWQATQDSSWIAVSLRHIGFCQQHQGKLEEALEAFLEGFELSKNVGTRRNVIRASMPIGNLYLGMGRAEEAREWCELAYELSLEESNIYGIQESCWCLYRIHEELNEPRKALDFYKVSMEARDSVFGKERTKELTSQEMRFVFEKEQLADSLAFVKQQIVKEKQIQTQRIGLVSVAMAFLMIVILAIVVYRGKQRSDHLLLNILPSEIAEELKEKGHAEAKHLPQVTVLFTDFKGFTELSEKMTPEELVNEMHDCFSRIDDIMSSHGVEKIKTIGDAYMAAGGVPVQTETHALDVVRAAIETQKFMSERARERKAKGLHCFEMRLGIHSGPVVAGIVGNKKFQYDIWGDTVNTAARMESTGEIGKVNISKATYDLIKDQSEFSFESRGKVEAKGKGKMEMWFVSLA